MGLWGYGRIGIGGCDLPRGKRGGIFLVDNATDSGRQIDGNNSFGVYAGSSSSNSQGMDRMIVNAESAGTVTLSCRFDVSNTVAFSGFNLKYAQGTHFGDDELVSVGLTPGTGNNSIAVNGGTQTINLGLTIPGQIVDFTLAYDCIAGTYTLGAKFRASGTFTYTSGALKVPYTVATVPVVAAYLGFGNFNTGNNQDFIADDLVLNTASLLTSGTLAVADTISGLTADTTYHYRVVTQNSNGTTYGADQILGFPLQPVSGSPVLITTSTSGNYQAWIYPNTGHVAIAGPSLSGSALGNVETITPPAVTVNASVYNLGPVVSSTTIANGLQLVQSFAGVTATTQLTFTADGVLNYQVPAWPTGIVPSQTVFTAGSPSTEHFFGFGEKFDSVDQTGDKVHILTFDNPGTKGDSSYKPVPFFMSNEGYGLHLGTTAESWFDMRKSATDRYAIQNLDSILNVNLIGGPKLTDVLTHYTGYTGRPFLPPAWVFGPWISCDIWPSGGEIRYALSTMLQDGIPVSAIVYDSPWSVSYNDFTWNMTQFGAGGTLDAGSGYSGFISVNSMMTFLQQSGVKAICWMTPFTDTSSSLQTITNQSGQSEPGGQNDGQASNYAAGAAGSYFVRSSAGGSPLLAPWWGGTGSPIDFTNPGAVAWFTGELNALITQSDVTAADGSQAAAIGGFKDDDGESGNGTNTYIPTTASYYDGRTGVDMENGFCVTYHRTVSSVLGSNGILMARSGFAGTGAFPGCWAGDNEPNFNQDGNGLNSVMIAGASAGLSGLQIWGSDTGAYQNTNFETNPADLFQRWAQFSCFSPIMEMHRQVSATNLQQYPWGYGATALANYVSYSKLHTQLFPFIYSYAKEATVDGLPIIRAPVLMNQTDTNTYGINQSFLFGNEFYVAPMNALNATSRGVYLPAGTWYDYWTQATYAGGQAITWSNSDPTKMPLFVKAGSIIPMLLDVPQSLCDANYVNNAAISTTDSGLQFLIYPGSGTAAFNVYDGTTIQSSVNGTVTNVALSSMARAVALQVWTPAVTGVQRNGVRMPQFASMGAFTSGTLGWIYSGGFLYVKFNHGGGAVNIGFGPDSIGDGVPDSWRSYYGVTNDQADSDGTGMTNLQKYLAGLNPNDPGSVFAIEGAGPSVSGTGFTVSWGSEPGLIYQVQGTQNLTSGTWQGVSANITGTGGLMSWTDGNPVSGKMFYRVEIPQ